MSIESIFQREGTMQGAGGNQPLCLSDPESVWRVQNGRVDVFVVQTKQGESAGARTFLFRVEAGNLLFGLSSLDAGGTYELFAAGVPETKVVRLNRKRLVEQCQTNDAGTREFISFLERWVDLLSTGIARYTHPRTYEPLQPGIETTLSGNQTAFPAENTRVVWVKTLTGESLFMGRKELPPVSQDGFVPLVENRTWLESTQETTLSSVDTSTYFKNDPQLHGLQSFHSLVMRCVYLNLSEFEQQNRERLQKKAQADEAALERAHTTLAGILAKEYVEGKAADAHGDNLLGACMLVGKVLDITFRPHPDTLKGLPQKNPLQNILRASRVRARKVILAGRWWTEDHGPFLAFIEEGNRPVALIQKSAARYIMVDPGTGAKTPVNEQVAGLLKPFGYAFYRPFPERAIVAADLFRLGLHRCSGELWTILGMGALTGGLALLMPLLTGNLFDTVIPQAEKLQLLQITLALVVSAFGSAAFTITNNIGILRLEGKLDSQLQSAVWDRLLELPAPFFRKYATGDLAQRAMGINQIRQILSGTTVTSILGSLFASFNFILLFYYSWKLAILGCALIFLSIATTLCLGWFGLRFARDMSDQSGKVSGKVLEYISGIAKFRMSGTESRAYANWAKEFAVQKDLSFKARFVQNSLITLNSVYPLLSTMAIYAAYSFYIKTGLTTGSFLAFTSSFNQFLSASLSMTQAFIMSLTTIPLYEGLLPILTTLPEVDAARSDPGELTGEIEVSHVNFRYNPDGPLILEDISLHIKPGQFVAFVGGSGSGKSTLFRLLLGFETPEAGTIYYDGKDLATLDLKSLRHQLGVVLQNGKIMSGDIFTNIIGASDLTIEDAWEAARLAGFEEDIRSFPMGMHTVVPQGGGTLSGGQRQRLLIARALVSKPKLIYFDEATSALDNQTQKIVSGSLEKLQATRVVIAHRLSTILNADYIYAFDKGKIIEEGTYDELMAKDGFFADLAKRQIA